MAFRESIEAVLKVKDAARFKSSMESAARSVRKFGRDEEAAAASTELLKSIESKLQRQNEELTATLEVVAHSVDNLGDQMLQTAAKARVFNAVAKKSGSSAFFLGKSFAFWKDRLSLTRSEIISTVATITAYFTPAIIALGSSFAYAALGGGAVAGAGLASLLFGLGALVTISRPVVGGIKDIWKAQDQYNQAVAEYGAASMQASRASAHLYGVIQTHGGKAVLGLVTGLRQLRKEWLRSTGPARGSVIGMIGSALGTGRVLLPQVAGEVNQMMAALRTAFGRGLSTLVSGPSGGEFRNTLRVLGDTFVKSIGPAMHGVSNLVLVFGRVIRAAAPWVVKLAKAWAAFTDRLVGKTADQSRVKKFLDGAVGAFKAWWGLARELGRTLGIIFGASKDEGTKIVGVLTNLVKRFNDWLQAASDTGKLRRFWQTYNQLVSDAVWALSHPIQAINKWLPMVMDAIATGLATHAPRAAEVFIRAFLNANAWAKLLTVGWFLKRFGFFGALGSAVAGPFVKAFVKRAAPGLAAAFLAEGTIGGAIVAGAASAGAALAAAVAAAAPIVIPVVLAVTAVGALAWLLGKIGHHNYNPHQSLKREAQHSLQEGGPRPLFTRQVPHHQSGGVIPVGGFGMVGEAGPEIAFAGPSGTRIAPLNFGSKSVDIPNLGGAMTFNLYTSVQIDKREVARAVSQQQAYDRARRS